MSHPGLADRYWKVTEELLNDAGAACATPLLRRAWRAIRPRRGQGRANYLEIVAIAASVKVSGVLFPPTEASQARKRLDDIELAIDNQVQELLRRPADAAAMAKLDALRKDIGLPPSPRPRAKRQ